MNNYVKFILNQKEEMMNEEVINNLINEINFLKNENKNLNLDFENKINKINKKIETIEIKEKKEINNLINEINYLKNGNKNLNLDFES